MPRVQPVVVHLQTSVRGLYQQLAKVPSWLLSCASRTVLALMLVINRILGGFVGWPQTWLAPQKNVENSTS